MKIKLLLLLLVITANVNLYAQHDKRLYFKVDLESGNVWTFAALTGISAGLNAATHMDLSINAFTVNTVKAKEHTDVKNYEWNKTGVEDLFNDIQTGARIGFKSDFESFVNVGFYTSVHYKVNQFKLEDFATKEFEKHAIHRVLFGLSALIQFGGWDRDFKAFFEAGARYAAASKYVNPYGADKSKLRNGIISHWALHFSPNGGTIGFQDIGVFFDMNHYNLLKDNVFAQPTINEIKMWTIGITVAITPGQAENR